MTEKEINRLTDEFMKKVMAGLGPMARILVSQIDIELVRETYKQGLKAGMRIALDSKD